ncbi:MAG: AMP-binding protein [Sulfurimicrobium sp.]|nr:AMP-binding protein [Sulfurimicrobium sp.]MDP2198611.1 AMP-binding protein [Sulfurimicrobium sp.]MDP3688207.1 AMP-binding protein [Sulfurimicrobium sp.]
MVSSCLFPLHEKLKHHDTVQIFKEMESTQWLSPEHLETLQVERLRAFMSKVAKHVPYYRNLFRDMAFDPAGISSISDLARLPFLTKAVIRANTAQLKSEIAQDLSRFNTGGSSGEPLIFFLGNERVSHDVAAKWRATRWWDVDIGDPEIVVWGSPIELGSQDRVRQIRDSLLRTKLLPAFEMSAAKLDGFVAEIRAMRPKMLFGYPSALAHIAQHAESRGQRMDDLGIRVAFVTSEKLYDHQREIISRIFGCKVANGYGGRDAGFIAHECPSGGMHLTAEDIIVEIVDEAGHPVPHGTAGEIVTTHLATGDFPFIRYRTGDIGVLDDQPCACGRGLPLLKEIQGRTTDFVVAQDGTVMHGLALVYVVRDIPGVKAFKIVQETLERTRIYLVTEPPFQPESRQTIIEGFKRRLGPEVDIQIEHVESIPKEASGKFRYIVSKVATANTGAAK